MEEVVKPTAEKNREGVNFALSQRMLQKYLCREGRRQSCGTLGNAIPMPGWSQALTQGLHLQTNLLVNNMHTSLVTAPELLP